MKFVVSLPVLSLFLLPFMVLAEERTVTPEQLAAIESGGEELETSRPTNLPDLTKGERVLFGIALLFIVAYGLNPALLLDIANPALVELLNLLSPLK